MLIVRSHGGVVHVESGSGTTFKVYLPAHQGVSGAVAPQESSRPLVRATVDDEEPPARCSKLLQGAIAITGRRRGSVDFL